MSNRLPEVCYFCGIPLDSTNNSKEHVPPRCFFPKNSNLRKKLITVPSCRVHNSGKSSNDEYFHQMVSINILANENSISAVVDTCTRGILRNKKLKAQLLKDATLVYIQRPNEKILQPTLTFNIDENRLKESLESISKALYFHEFHTPFFGEIEFFDESRIFLDGKNSLKLNQELEKVWATSAELFKYFKKKGENSNIFYYQVLHSPVNEKDYFLTLKLCFYEGVSFIVFFKSKKEKTINLKFNPVFLGIKKNLIKNKH